MLFKTGAAVVSVIFCQIAFASIVDVNLTPPGPIFLDKQCSLKSNKFLEQFSDLNSITKASFVEKVCSGKPNLKVVEKCFDGAWDWIANRDSGRDIQVNFIARACCKVQSNTDYSDCFRFADENLQSLGSGESKFIAVSNYCSSIDYSPKNEDKQRFDVYLSKYKKRMVLKKAAELRENAEMANKFRTAQPACRHEAEYLKCLEDGTNGQNCALFWCAGYEQ